MMTLIVGGSGSGKSEFAEQMMLQYQTKRYYVATMKVYDEEGMARVRRHQEMRAKKNFTTIEQPMDIGRLNVELDCSVLVECVSNLLANEMFDRTPCSKESLADKIVSELKLINSNVQNLVIVSNEIFSDGIMYEKTMMEYINILGDINKKLAAYADEVIEVVYSIPVYVKKYEPYKE